MAADRERTVAGPDDCDDAGQIDRGPGKRGGGRTGHRDERIRTGELQSVSRCVRDDQRAVGRFAIEIDPVQDERIDARVVGGGIRSGEEIGKCEFRGVQAWRDDPAGRAREYLIHALLNHNDFITIR